MGGQNRNSRSLAMTPLEVAPPDMARVAVALMAMLLMLGCSRGGSAPAPVQMLSNYPGAQRQSLQEKISLGTGALLDWQHQINLKYGQDTRPTMAMADNPLVAEVRNMAARLPRRIKDLAARHMVALYLLENDWGTGTTEAVQDGQGRWKYAYIALNLTALTRTANAWGSWKESSAFRPEKGHEIRMILEEPGEDTEEAAIRFIFLHELGHALGLALGAHGWWDAEGVPRATRNSPYLAVSWRYAEEGKMASRWAAQYPGFAKLAYYSFDKAKLPGDAAEGLFRDLSKTDFPSLYGATNIFDDFAEAFAIYVHTRMLGKPYRVEIYRNGKRRFTYRSCIATGGCPKKVAALKALAGL